MTYIKRLVMHGFKSFPRKTEVPFTQGINVILGANGSGKSNVSDAICFVLGRLSIKSIRAAKASNLIFMGTKSAAPVKEAAVEITFDNSQKTFSLQTDEVTIKRVVRKNGQSLYKINNETKTRQEILSLLAQAGIDPQGFNIILQGEIQNFVRMQPEERRGVLEEVSGISIYESRKEKSLKELEKTEEKLKEVSSILKERTLHLNNLERERQEALKYKKLESDIKKFKASIISHDLRNGKKESEKITSEIEKRNSGINKIKGVITSLEKEMEDLRNKINEINLEIQRSTGIEQERLNREIANLRADLAGINVNLGNYKSRLTSLSNQKEELKSSLKEIEDSINNLQKESPTPDRKRKEIEDKKKKIEELEKQREKFYAIKSEINSLEGRIKDKISLLQNFSNESEKLIHQSESISIGIFDPRANSQKLNEAKSSLIEKKESLSNLMKREMELEKINSINESEIENQKKLLQKISKIDVCPICKNKITAEHMHEIEHEVKPVVDRLQKEIESADKELRGVYQKKDILTKDIEELTQKISQTETDLNKISNINEKKEQIKSLNEKSENLKKEISELEKKKKNLERTIEGYSNIDQKYETLNVEIQEISLRTRETISSEVSFKQRDLERIRISLKQISREEEDLKEKARTFQESFEEKEKDLSLKRKQEEELTKKFKTLIDERDSLHSKTRQKESEALSKQNDVQNIEREINEFKIDMARVRAEIENLETELLEFPDIEILGGSKESLVQRFEKAKEIISRIGTVNLRSLEVYDSIKKEYDSIQEKVDIISSEKEGIMKIVSEIDMKKKRTLLQTLNKINELFSRNFSQLSTKGQVFLELENKQDPFAGGISIVVKTGHGKYFDVRSLSGGEQTLVALSLIFAIQEYRPYSFYLLDEIDAALDKRNSERLAQLLNRYMQDGQYIVITHNDEVISRATNLYGISMHDGVSKIISQSLGEPEEKESHQN
ncbi:MAG: chromosome segregation SMC family protein [Nanoarchaeota archaeon]|nr:chromosome segregation SMC family protein [Nanoarchaeota archaeon]